MIYIRQIIFSKRFKINCYDSYPILILFKIYLFLPLTKDSSELRQFATVNFQRFARSKFKNWMDIFVLCIK